MEKDKKPYSAARWHEPPVVSVILCSYCKHLHIDSPGLVCDAFPDGVPKEHTQRGETENLQPIMLTKEMAKVCNNGIGFERGPQFPDEEI